MRGVSNEEIARFIEPKVEDFCDKRLENLLNLRLNQLLSRRNPYLFEAKNQNTAHDLVKTLLDAHLSSLEEGIFGGFLEELAVFICGRVYGGIKSSAEEIDLEFTKGDTLCFVSIKSGPNWGNSEQIKRMRDSFRKARRIRQTNTTAISTVFVNGCCYGKDDVPDKGDYLKLCGQRFWEFISGDDALYVDIIEPIGYKPKEKNDQFHLEYAKALNRFTFDFAEKFCSADGAILWDRLVHFNSGKSSD